MKLTETEAIVEAVLFAAGDPVDTDRISDILDIDKKSTRVIVGVLAEKYDIENRGLKIIRLEDSYQMCTRDEYREHIAKLVEPRRSQTLSNAAMEVLSIIAYKQPVTRSVIEQIRGVSCDTLVNKLIERGLIHETGRLDAPGRPMLFGTTEEFLRCFGISSVTELPEFEKNSSDAIPNADSELTLERLIEENERADAENRAAADSAKTMQATESAADGAKSGNTADSSEL